MIDGFARVFASAQGASEFVVDTIPLLAVVPACLILLALWIRRKILLRSEKNSATILWAPLLVCVIAFPWLPPKLIAVVIALASGLYIVSYIITLGICIEVAQTDDVPALLWACDLVTISPIERSTSYIW